MRGKESSSGRLPETKGITPAYAGKSVQQPYGKRGRWDHPRLCGEKG